MADKKDNPPSKETAKSELTTSDSLEKPLLDKNTPEKKADIDTSHLSLDESPGSSESALESEKEQDIPGIKTSHLSLKDDDKKSSDATPSINSTENLTQDNKSTSEKAADIPPVDPSERKPAATTENLLYVKNPLAKDTPDPTTDSPADEVDNATEKNDTAEEVMLTTGISDAEFDKEIQDDAVVKNSRENLDNKNKSKSKSKSNDDTENPIKSILDTVKKPESIVQNAWSNSSARRFLIDNVESFRVKDEDHNMESVIEKMYGGSVEKKFAPGKFLKQNLLFSFLIFVLLFLIGWKAASVFFPELMPQLNDQIIETVQNTTGRKKPAKPVKKKEPVVTNYANKEKIDEVLSHCLVEPNARTAFSLAFISVGYEFSNRSLSLSYDEVSDSIRRWKNLDMEFYISDATFRFRELAKLALPVTQDAKKIVSDYKQSLLTIQAQADELKDSIRKIQTSSGNQTTYTINERIPLMSKLDKLDTRLTAEPEQKRFDQLLMKLALVEGILSGEIEPERFEPDQLTEEDPEWLMSTAETASSEIASPITGNVLPAIKIPADKLKKVFPKLTAFNLSELESALNDLIKLSSLINYLPENILIPYKLELSGLNRRLDKTMKADLAAWMSFDRCLVKGRAEIPAAE